MAYRFKLDESFSKGFHRIGLEQLDRAMAQLRRAATGAGVHETRKSIKRLRALLRLVRPGLDSEAFERFNLALRDAGRVLSAARDNDVLIKTMALIGADTPAARPALRRLVKNVSAKASVAGPQQNVAKHAATMLADVRKDWSDLQLTPDSFAVLAEGLERGVQKLAESHQAVQPDARPQDGDEDYHDLRKAVQRHWRQMRLIEAGWPEYFSARWAEAKSISELLGSAQDLGLLLTHLAEHGRPLLKPSQVAQLDRIVRERRDNLRDAARSRCARLVAEGAKAQARRAALFWSTAIALRRAASTSSDNKARAAEPPAVRQAAERAVRPARKSSSKPKTAAKRKASRNPTRKR